MNKERDRDIIYSTVHRNICPACGMAISNCRCVKKETSASKGDGVVRVRRETKGRGGKTMTAIHGVPLDGKGLEELASKLKRSMGTGGAVKEGVIEIQGDHRDLLVEELKARGWAVRRSGA